MVANNQNAKSVENAQQTPANAENENDSVLGADVLKGRLALGVKRLREALAGINTENQDEDVVRYRNELRMLSVELRTAGFWAENKQPLRDLVALLWEADRYMGARALDSINSAK